MTARIHPAARAGRMQRTAKGFTLIELMVAIAIMALIALMSWRGIDGMGRSQQVTQKYADDILVLQAALGQWGADLDAMMPMANTTPVDWNGQVLRITRRSSAVPDNGALVVAWALRNQEWTRWQSGPLRSRTEWQQAWQSAQQWASGATTDPLREVRLMPLLNWQLFYYRNNAWSNPQSSVGTDNNTNPGSGNNPANPNAPGSGNNGKLETVPDGIRLQLQLPEGRALTGQLTRDWVRPTQGGGK